MGRSGTPGQEESLTTARFPVVRVHQSSRLRQGFGEGPLRPA